ncbi:MAG: hypothetical protein WC508_03300 [Patescibacteria group bacterium]
MRPNIAIEKNLADENVVQYWGFFTPEEISAAAKSGEILMLDIDFGRQCSLSCPGCFRRKNLVDLAGQTDLSYEKLLAVLAEAAANGLKSVKICGAGEPFENPRLLELAKDLTSMNVGLAIFTKGHVIGDDIWTKKIFGQQGITDGLTLCQKLFELKTSVMLYYPTLSNNELFSRLVGDRTSRHPQRACLAAERLALAGFNKTRPTRLMLVHTPVTKDSVGGALAVYKFARQRNILPLIAFYMVSGTQITKEFLERYDPSDKQKLELFWQVYRYNLDHGIQSPEQLVAEGISCMPGIHPCNQIAVGMYLTANGNVIRCPGDCAGVLGNVQQESLIAIWQRVRQWPFAGRSNCGCPYKDGRTVPLEIYRPDFFHKILDPNK